MKFYRNLQPSERKEVKEKMLKLQEVTKKQLAYMEQLAEPIKKSLQAQKKVLANEISFEEYMNIELAKQAYMAKFTKLLDKVEDAHDEQ